MINLNKKLIMRSESGNTINVAVIGIGQMGKGLVSQMSLMKGMRPAILCDHTVQKAIDAYMLANISKEDIVTANTYDEAQRAVENGKFAVCDDFETAIKCSSIDVVVDATGYTDAGALIATCAIQNHKHIVMLNVETDVTIGHILNYKAKKEGVVYSASSGDEPGAVKELYDFAEAIGLDILVMGKGKNNKVDIECNPNTVYKEALNRGIAPKMLASFKDGTKTMVELTCMSNSTGFLPDIRGAHGAKVNLDNVCDILRLKDEGGILNNYKVVEYTDGLAPGVFIIVTTDLPQIHHEIQYLKIGKGPNYILYRPYHLTSLETPITIARAVIYNEASLFQLDGAPVSETVTIAKKDLHKGEKLDGIGGFCVYGTIEKYSIAKSENFVPIGLINKNTTVLRDVKKGQLITYADISLDESSPVLHLRKLQEKIIG